MQNVNGDVSLINAADCLTGGAVWLDGVEGRRVLSDAGI